MAASDVVWIVSSLWYAYLHTHSSKLSMTIQFQCIHSKNQIVLANNLVTVVMCISPSNANQKNAVLGKQIQSELIQSELILISLPLQPQHSFNYHRKDSLALFFPC